MKNISLLVIAFCFALGTQNLIAQTSEKVQYLKFTAIEDSRGNEKFDFDKLITDLKQSNSVDAETLEKLATIKEAGSSMQLLAKLEKFGYQLCGFSVASTNNDMLIAQYILRSGPKAK